MYLLRMCAMYRVIESFSNAPNGSMNLLLLSDETHLENDALKRFIYNLKAKSVIKLHFVSVLCAFIEHL